MLDGYIMDLTSKSITFHQNIVIARSGKVTDKSRSSTLSIAYYRRFLFFDRNLYKSFLSDISCAHNRGVRIKKSISTLYGKIIKQCFFCENKNFTNIKIYIANMER